MQLHASHTIITCHRGPGIHGRGQPFSLQLVIHRGPTLRHLAAHLHVRALSAHVQACMRIFESTSEHVYIITFNAACACNERTEGTMAAGWMEVANFLNALLCVRIHGSRSSATIWTSASNVSSCTCLGEPPTHCPPHARRDAHASRGRAPGRPLELHVRAWPAAIVCECATAAHARRARAPVSCSMRQAISAGAKSWQHGTPSGERTGTEPSVVNPLFRTEPWR